MAKGILLSPGANKMLCTPSSEHHMGFHRKTPAQSERFCVLWAKRRASMRTPARMTCCPSHAGCVIKGCVNISCT